jgi:hypothetical protein
VVASGIRSEGRWAGGGRQEEEAGQCRSALGVGGGGGLRPTVMVEVEVAPMSVNEAVAACVQASGRR